jgi:tRNA pseudouridine65 synthase
MQIEILFEDDYIVIVNKPNNVLIHNSYYARNIKDDTLLDLLQKQFETSFYPVHRLDRKTSGVIVLAKKKEYVTIFQDLFNSNKIEKTYIAIVRGFFETEVVVNSPVKNPDTKVYKEAETFCEPIATKLLDIPVRPYQTSRYSLIKLKPATGRMHQLRIHMNKISHPIVGDYKYGDRFHNRMFETEFKCHNLFLHAYSIQFEHPISKKNINIKASFTDDWILVFKIFNWNFN